MSKIGITIVITKRQFDFVESEAKRLDISTADVVRRVLDKHIDAVKTLDPFK